MDKHVRNKAKKGKEVQGTKASPNRTLEEFPKTVEFAVSKIMSQ